jgi:hypothetical protein
MDHRRRGEKRPRAPTRHPEHERNRKEQHAARGVLPPRGQFTITARLDDQVPRRVQQRSCKREECRLDQR